MNWPKIYEDLCRSTDPGQALDRLGDGVLAGLHVWLEASGVTAGIPAIVAGLVELEIVKRWVAGNKGNFSPVGEG